MMVLWKIYNGKYLFPCPQPGCRSKKYTINHICLRSIQNEATGNVDDTPSFGENSLHNKGGKSDAVQVRNMIRDGRCFTLKIPTMGPDNHGDLFEQKIKNQ